MTTGRPSAPRANAITKLPLDGRSPSPYFSRALGYARSTGKTGLRGASQARAWPSCPRAADRLDSRASRHAPLPPPSLIALVLSPNLTAAAPIYSPAMGSAFAKVPAWWGRRPRLLIASSSAECSCALIGPSSKTAPRTSVDRSRHWPIMAWSSLNPSAFTMQKILWRGQADGPPQLRGRIGLRIASLQRPNYNPQPFVWTAEAAKDPRSCQTRGALDSIH